MSELARTADRLIVLGRGRVLADDSVEALISQYGTRLENGTATASLEEAYLTLTRDHSEHLAKETR
jgi:ABC-type multidrug transport system ATPase subunit